MQLNKNQSGSWPSGFIPGFLSQNQCDCCHYWLHPQTVSQTLAFYWTFSHIDKSNQHRPQNHTVKFVGNRGFLLVQGFLFNGFTPYLAFLSGLFFQNIQSLCDSLEDKHTKKRAQTHLFSCSKLTVYTKHRTGKSPSSQAACSSNKMNAWVGQFLVLKNMLTFYFWLSLSEKQICMYIYIVIMV